MVIHSIWYKQFLETSSTCWCVTRRRRWSQRSRTSRRTEKCLGCIASFALQLLMQPTCLGWGVQENMFLAASFAHGPIELILHLFKMFELWIECPAHWCHHAVWLSFFRVLGFLLWPCPKLSQSPGCCFDFMLDSCIPPGIICGSTTLMSFSELQPSGLVNAEPMKRFSWWMVRAKWWLSCHQHLLPTLLSWSENCKGLAWNLRMRA